MKRQLIRSVGILAVILQFSACTVQLAPSYSQPLVEGLTGTSQTVLQFLSSASSGTSTTDFQSRSGTYNQLIGSVDALKIQATARPVPASKILDKINETLQKKGLPALSGETPSATALQGIADNLSQMRDSDKSHGLTATEVKLFKGNITIYLAQALTYENYLKR